MALLSKFTTGSVALVTLVAASCSNNNSSTAQHPHASFPSLDYLEFENFRSSTVKPDKDCDERCVRLRNEFAYVVNTGELIYAYWDFKITETGINYTELAKNLENQITSKTSVSEYALILRRWASSLHDGHVNGMLPDDLSPLEMYSTNNRLEVLSPGTDHETLIVADAGGFSGIQPGDKIISVDGVSSHDALDEVEKMSSGSTKRMRRFFGARRITDVLGINSGSNVLKLEIQNSDGKTKTVEIPRQVVFNLPPSTAAAAEDTGLSLFKATVLPNQIGYLRIDGFTGTQDEFILGQAMDRLAQTKALILDLRKNGGGDLSGNKIISRLISKKAIRYKVSENLNPFLISQRPEYFFLQPQPDKQYALWHNWEVEPAQAEEKNYLNKPVFALTSPNCFSACDTFTAALKSNRLATIVGEATGGGTGTPLVFDLPQSKMRFRYSVVRGKTSDDLWIEGHGTLPDIVIEPTIEERTTRIDAQLAKVIALAVKSTQEQIADQPADALQAANIVTKQFGHPMDQSLDVTPTIAEDMMLKRLAPRDER